MGISAIAERIARPYHAAARLHVPSGLLGTPRAGGAVAANIETSFIVRAPHDAPRWRSVIDLPEGMRDAHVSDTFGGVRQLERTPATITLEGGPGMSTFTITGSLNAASSPHLKRVGGVIDLAPGAFPRGAGSDVTAPVERGVQTSLDVPAGWEVTDVVGGGRVKESSMLGARRAVHELSDAGTGSLGGARLAFTGRLGDDRVAGMASLGARAKEVAWIGASVVAVPFVGLPL